MKKLLLLFICIAIMLTGCRSIGRIVKQNGIEKAEAEHDKLTEKTLQEESITVEDFFADIPEQVNMTLTKGDYIVEIDAPVIIGTDKLYTGRLKHKKPDIEKVKQALFGDYAEKLVLYDHPEDFGNDTVYILPDEDDTLIPLLDGFGVIQTDDGKNALGVLFVDNESANTVDYINTYRDLCATRMYGIYPLDALPGCSITVEEAEKKVDDFLEAIGEDSETWYKSPVAHGTWTNPTVGFPEEEGTDSYYDFALYKKVSGIPVIGNEYYQASMRVSEKGIIELENCNFSFEEMSEAKELDSIIPIEEALKLLEDELDLIGQRIQDKESFVDIRSAERKIVEIRLEYYMENGNEFIPTWYLVEESDLKMAEKDIGTDISPHCFNIRINAMNGDYIGN